MSNILGNPDNTFSPNEAYISCMNYVMREPVFGVLQPGQHKLVCLATEDG